MIVGLIVSSKIVSKKPGGLQAQIVMSILHQIAV